MNIKKILLSVAMVGSLASQAMASDDVKAQLAFGRASVAKQEQLADDLMTRDAGVRGRLAAKYGAGVPAAVVQAITADGEGAIVPASTVADRVAEVDTLFDAGHVAGSLYAKTQAFLAHAKQSALGDLAIKILRLTPQDRPVAPADRSLNQFRGNLFAGRAGLRVGANFDITQADTMAARDELIGIFTGIVVVGQVRAQLLALAPGADLAGQVAALRDKAPAIWAAADFATLLPLISFKS